MSEIRDAAKSWSQVLESLHSAIVDELIHRRADLKPILGMPMRQSVCAAPSAGLESALASRAMIGGSEGLALFAWDSGFSEVVKVAEAKLFWEALLLRAKPEFARRHVSPVFQSSQGVSTDFTLPSGFMSPARLIWFPFEVGGSRCFLGLGM